MLGLSDVFHVVPHHDADEFGEGRFLGVPAEACSGLCRIAQQLLYFRGTEIFGIHFHEYAACRLVDASFVHALTFPTQLYPRLMKGHGTEFAHGMHFSGGDDEVLGLVLLENKPHAL